MKTNDYLKIATLDELRATRRSLSEEISAVEKSFLRRIRITVHLWHTLCKILSHG